MLLAIFSLYPVSVPAGADGAFGSHQRPMEIPDGHNVGSSTMESCDFFMTDTELLFLSPPGTIFNNHFEEIIYESKSKKNAVFWWFLALIY